MTAPPGVQIGNCRSYKPPPATAPPASGKEDGGIDDGDVDKKRGN